MILQLTSHGQATFQGTAQDLSDRGEDQSTQSTHVDINKLAESMYIA